MRFRWPGFALVVAILGFLEVATMQAWIDPFTMPRISTIFSSLWDSLFVNGTLRDEMLPTMKRLVIGYGIACAVAVPVGLAMGSFRIVYRLLEPITEFLRPIPSSAYIPVAMFFLGIDDGMKIFVIALASVFPILVATYGSVQDIDPVLIDTARTFHVSRATTVRKVVLPAAMPAVLTGMRVSLGISLIVAVVAEMISGSSGIGYFILDAQRQFRPPEMFAGIVILGIVGFGLNVLFLWVEHRILRWRPEASSI